VQIIEIGVLIEEGRKGKRKRGKRKRGKRRKWK